MKLKDDLIRQCGIHSDGVNAAIDALPSSIVLNMTYDQLRLSVLSIHASHKAVYKLGYDDGAKSALKKSRPPAGDLP
jgi:hypothetical protein